MSLHLDIEHVAEFRTATADESATLGLPSQRHGLVLLTTEDESRWTLATADLEFFDMYVSAMAVEDPQLAAVVLHTGGRTWRLIYDWPASGTPHELNNPERNQALD